MLQTFSTCHWKENFTPDIQQIATTSLEDGQILYFPKLTFSLSEEEKKFLTPDCADPHSKNVGYHPKANQLWGVQRLSDKERMQLKAMLARFSQSALNFVQKLFPRYAQQVVLCRTSFRPVQISGRVTSYRKDDKRLHVDAFPSAPNQGKRILRVFCNINEKEDRVWRIGEDFEAVAKRFLPHVNQPFPGAARLLRMLKITKSYRTSYDHYMLHIHDKMKADENYQQESQQQELRFPPGCTWVVQTDHVSHAAMQGQHVLEQTFHLPITAMENELKSPLRVLERLLDRKLI